MVRGLTYTSRRDAELMAKAFNDQGFNSYIEKTKSFGVTLFRVFRGDPLYRPARKESISTIQAKESAALHQGFSDISAMKGKYQKSTKKRQAPIKTQIPTEEKALSDKGLSGKAQTPPQKTAQEKYAEVMIEETKKRREVEPSVQTIHIPLVKFKGGRTVATPIHVSEETAKFIQQREQRKVKDAKYTIDKFHEKYGTTSGDSEEVVYKKMFGSGFNLKEVDKDINKLIKATRTISNEGKLSYEERGLIALAARVDAAAQKMGFTPKGAYTGVEGAMKGTAKHMEKHGRPGIRMVSEGYGQTGQAMMEGRHPKIGSGVGYERPAIGTIRKVQPMPEPVPKSLNADTDSGLPNLNGKSKGRVPLQKTIDFSKF